MVFPYKYIECGDPKMTEERGFPVIYKKMQLSDSVTAKGRVTINAKKQYSIEEKHSDEEHWRLAWLGNCEWFLNQFEKDRAVKKY